ncbi:MAG TPA: PepSY-associated TM helix domain-containing protein [Gammaproteobacteria bacterium]
MAIPTAIRKTFFWMHLSCGVLCGLVILMMSATGVVLTYERQIVDWANRDLHAAAAPGAPRLPLASLAAAAQLAVPDFAPTAVTIDADPTAPATISAGRGRTLFVNPYSGAVLGEGASDVEAFFSAVTGWHRWFNAQGDDRALWRAVTGVSNLAFLFLILSGMYLWLPRVYKWAMFRTRLFFSAQALSSGPARDFNWHHVVGIWTAIPLAVIVASGSIFYYPWANALVYRAFGEEPPGQGGGPPPGGPQQSGRQQGGAQRQAPVSAPTSEVPALDVLFDVAASRLEGWRMIGVQLPRPGDATVQFTIDEGNGGQPQLRHTLTLDAATGAVVAWNPFSSQTPGRQARSWVRFLHTGEALGILGQTVAGLVSLTSTLMVWTGLALAYRRLIAPLVGRMTHLTTR